jgi:hypothetical protein
MKKEFKNVLYAIIILLAFLNVWQLMSYLTLEKVAIQLIESLDEEQELNLKLIKELEKQN